MYMQGSQSIRRLQEEEREEIELLKEARKMRKEMRERGHVVPARKGMDVQQDAREKRLQKTATRGVVQLFNAINAAQKRLQNEDAKGNKSKVARLGKASFLAEMKNMRRAEGQQEAKGQPEAKGQQDQRTRSTSNSKAARSQHQGNDDVEEGWDVLREGFVGLRDGSKMKDWDKNDGEDQLDDDTHVGGPITSDEEEEDW